MKKYNKIAMTERIVFANNMSLFQILKDHYPDLYNREQGRIELTYGGDNPGVMTPQLEKHVNDYNHQTSLLYKAMGVPQYIIATQEADEPIKEYATDTILTTRGINNVLLGRKVTEEAAYKYLDETTSYIEMATKFLKKEEKKSLVKKAVNQITSKKDN